MKRINYRKIYKNINENKYLSGIALLILNLFSKYVKFNLTKSQEEFIKNFLTKEIFIFIIIFVGLRDIFVAFLITIIFTIIINTLFHNKSKFCLIPEKYKKLDNNNDINKNQITYEEIKNAKEVLQKAGIKNYNINI